MANNQPNEEVKPVSAFVVNARGELDFPEHAKEVEKEVAAEKAAAEDAKRKATERRLQEDR